jgi:hypothetical protein
MKNTYKYITLHGNALPPMASGHYHEIRKMTHFSEYSQNNIPHMENVLSFMKKSIENILIYIKQKHNSNNTISQ